MLYPLSYRGLTMQVQGNGSTQVQRNPRSGYSELRSRFGDRFGREPLSFSCFTYFTRGSTMTNDKNDANLVTDADQATGATTAPEVTTPKLEHLQETIDEARNAADHALSEQRDD